MTRKWYLKLSAVHVAHFLLISLIVSFFINEYFVSTLESSAVVKPVIIASKSIKATLSNKSIDPDDVSAPFKHPLYFPTHSETRDKPSIVIKGYKKYVHRFQNFVKGLLAKVKKVNVSVGKFFSKFKKDKKKTTVDNKNNAGPVVDASDESNTVNSDNFTTESDINTKIEDHIEMDVSLLNLDLSQVALLHAAVATALSNNANLQAWADETHLIISPHLAYRYYISVDWSDNYNEHSVDKAIVETVQWRKDFGIGKMDTTSMSSYVEQGLAYTSNVPDRFGRAVIYLKLGKYHSGVTAKDFLNLVMYTVERADRMSVQFGSGEFVTVMDFEGFTWSSCPPIAYLKEAIILLRMHYPYRLAGIYILNTSGAFNFIWSLLTPFLPRKALQKTVMIPKHDVKRLLPNLIGVENLEESYGGLQRDANSNVQEYFASGYWSSVNQEQTL